MKKHISNIVGGIIAIGGYIAPWGFYHGAYMSLDYLCDWKDIKLLGYIYLALALLLIVSSLGRLKSLKLYKGLVISVSIFGVLYSLYLIGVARSVAIDSNYIDFIPSWGRYVALSGFVIPLMRLSLSIQGRERKRLV